MYVRINHYDGEGPVNYGDTALLTWGCPESATAAYIGTSGSNYEAVQKAGSLTTKVIKSEQTYWLRCDDASGNIYTKNVKVNLPNPSLTLTATGVNSGTAVSGQVISVDYASKVTLSWTSEGVSHCAGAKDWEDTSSFTSTYGHNKPSSGSETTGELTIYPKAKKEYWISCAGFNGDTISKNVFVTVKNPW